MYAAISLAGRSGRACLLFVKSSIFCLSWNNLRDTGKHLWRTSSSGLQHNAKISAKLQGWNSTGKICKQSNVELVRMRCRLSTFPVTCWWKWNCHPQFIMKILIWTSAPVFSAQMTEVCFSRSNTQLKNLISDKMPAANSPTKRQVCFPIQHLCCSIFRFSVCLETTAHLQNMWVPEKPEAVSFLSKDWSRRSSGKDTTILLPLGLRQNIWQNWWNYVVHFPCTIRSKISRVVCEHKSAVRGHNRFAIGSCWSYFNCAFACLSLICSHQRDWSI